MKGLANNKLVRMAYAMYMTLRLAGLGDGLLAKFALFWFLFTSRLSRSTEVVSKKFPIRVRGISLQIAVRNNFADPHVLHEAFIGHDYDRGLLSEPPGVIFDVGANVGYISLYLKTKYPNARIFCFEPDPETFIQLVTNTKQYADITCFQWALDAQGGMRTFYRSKTFHMRNSLIAAADSDHVTVESKTFKEALKRTGVAQVDLLKIDIEGGELELFESDFPFEKIGHAVGELHPYLWPAEAYERLIALLRRHFSLSLRQEGKKIFFTGRSIGERLQ